MKLDLTIEAEKKSEAVPAGTYTALIEHSEKELKKQGATLCLRWLVMEGPQKGRRIFDRLYLEHPSQQTRQIAFERLMAIGRACGLKAGEALKDSSQLHDIPCKVTVKQSGEYTNVSSVKALDSVDTRPAKGSVSEEQARSWG